MKYVFNEERIKQLYTQQAFFCSFSWRISAPTDLSEMVLGKDKTHLLTLYGRKRTKSTRAETMTNLN